MDRMILGDDLLRYFMLPGSCPASTPGSFVGQRGQTTDFSARVYQV